MIRPCGPRLYNTSQQNTKQNNQKAGYNPSFTSGDIVSISEIVSIVIGCGIIDGAIKVIDKLKDNKELRETARDLIEEVHYEDLALITDKIKTLVEDLNHHGQSTKNKSLTNAARTLKKSYEKTFKRSIHDPVLNPNTDEVILAKPVNSTIPLDKTNTPQPIKKIKQNLKELRITVSDLFLEKIDDEDRQGFYRTLGRPFRDKLDEVLGLFEIKHKHAKPIKSGHPAVKPPRDRRLTDYIQHYNTF